MWSEVGLLKEDEGLNDFGELMGCIYQLLDGVSSSSLESIHYGDDYFLFNVEGGFCCG